MKQGNLKWLSFIVITMMSAWSLTLSAQTMTMSKVKQAGVIVLADQDWLPFKATGHLIHIRLNDKARPKHKKNEIMIHEIDCKTQTKNVYTVTISKDDFGVDDEEISIVRFNTPINEKDFLITNESKGLFFCSYRNIDNDFNQYEIKVVLFYKTYADVLTGQTLGEEWDLGKAYQYIKEMFKSYLK